MPVQLYLSVLETGPKAQICDSFAVQINIQIFC